MIRSEDDSEIQFFGLQIASSPIPYSPDLALSDDYLFLKFIKYCVYCRRISNRIIFS